MVSVGRVRLENMKLLHTSDLHLGRSFHGRSLDEEQGAVHRELVRVCQEEGIQVVLVAGDVYDQASPRTDVIRQLSALLQELHEIGVSVVLTSGNHDSPARLSFAAPLLRGAGVHLITEIEQITQPVRLGKDPQGRDILIYGIPYLEPRHAAGILGTQPTHQAVLAEAARRIQEDWAHHPDSRAVIMAHCFAVGGSETDSERSLEQGNLAAVGTGIFSPFDYAALGHLHGRQQLSETIRYSGSPLPFSFSETEQRKGYWILDFAAEGLRISGGLWQEHLKLARLRGTLEQLLSDPDYAWAEDCLCQITLTDRQRPVHPMERLRKRFPETLELRFSGLSERKAISYARTVAAAQSPEQICSSFYARVRQRELSGSEQRVVEGAVREAEHSLRTTEGER